MSNTSNTLNIKSEFSPSQSEGYFPSQNEGHDTSGDFGEHGWAQNNHFESQDVCQFGQQQSQEYPSGNMNVKISTTPWKSRANQSQAKLTGNRRANTNAQSQARNVMKIDTPGAIGNNNVQYYLSNRAKTKSRRPSQLYACNFCGKMFTTSSGLYFHKPIHTGEWKLKCNLCDRGYMEQSKYDKHIATHRKQFSANRI